MKSKMNNETKMIGKQAFYQKKILKVNKNKYLR